MKKRETEGSKANYSALALVEAARTAEKEALVKLVHLTEEADNSIRKGNMCDRAVGCIIKCQL